MGLFDSVTALFILLWKFLAYMLNITHHLHITSYANCVHFIAYVYSNCIVCNSEWMIESDVVTLYGARRGTGKGEQNFSGFP